MTLFTNSPYRVVKNYLNKKIIQKDERLPDGDSIVVNICFFQMSRHPSGEPSEVLRKMRMDKMDPD